MTKIPDFNLNHFKVFMAVFESGSMTQAAQLLHLTQSGVSQHIKALETDMSHELFTRVGRRLVPTAIARQLYPDIEKAFKMVNDRLSQLTGEEQELEGEVRIGMPIEYGTNIIVPKLAKLGLKYPKLRYQITLDDGSVLAKMVVDGLLDFAFVDEAPWTGGFSTTRWRPKNFTCVVHESTWQKNQKLNTRRRISSNLNTSSTRAQNPFSGAGCFTI